MRISDKTLLGLKKMGREEDDDFFAVCGEVREGTAPGGREGFRKLAVHFDKAGGRGRAFIEPEESEMAALFESSMEPCR